MNNTPMSKSSRLFSEVRGWVLILAVVGGGAYFMWTIHKNDPANRLAGVWAYDNAGAWNAADPAGRGSRLEFSGSSVSVFDAGGSKVHSYAWNNYKYSDGSTGEFPTTIFLMETDSEFDGFVMVSLTPDEQSMRFHMAAEGPSRAVEFRRVP